MNRSVLYLAATLTLAIVLATPVTAQKKLYGNREREGIHIYVFTAENSSGFLDADSEAHSKDSAESVADLKKVLSRAHFTVVDSQSNANFSIAVEPGYLPAGDLGRPRRVGGFSSTVSNDDVAALRLTVAAGDYSTTILATSLSLSGSMLCRCHSYGTWNWAAVMAEPQLDTWVRSNYDHLIALRNSGK